MIDININNIMVSIFIIVITFASVVWDTLPGLLFTSTMIGSEASRNLCTTSSWLHWDTSTPFTWE